MVPQITYGDRVLSIAVTPDGQYFVSGNADKTIKLWHLATGSLVRTFADPDEVRAVAITPDGLHIVAASAHGTMRLWDIKTGAHVRTFGGWQWLYSFTGSVSSIVVTPDGQHIIAGGYADGAVKIWDITTGALLRTILAAQGSVNSVAVTPDGGQIVTGGNDQSVKLWDIANGALLRSMAGHQKQVNSVSVTADGRHILSASEDGGVKLWDLATGGLERSFEVGEGAADTAAVTSDGKYVVSGVTSIKVIDIAKGTVVSPFEHSGATVVAVTPDSRNIITGYRSISVLDMATGTAEREFVAGDWVWSVTVAPDSRHIASVNTSKIKFWELTTGAVVHTAEARGSALAFTPDGRHILSEGDSQTVKLWDPVTETVVRTFAGHKAGIVSIEVTPDSRYVVSGANDGSIRQWDIKTGKLVHTFESHQTWVNPIAITPDSRYIVSGSEHAIKLWDLATGKLLRTFAGHQGLVFSVAVTPDGRQVVSGSGDGTVKIWDLRAGTLLRTLLASEDLVTSVAVTPDGSRILSVGDNETIKVWDLKTGVLVSNLWDHQGPVDTVAVTPDGRRAVAGSTEGTIRIWDLSSGRLLATLIGDNDSTLALTPDGFFNMDAANKGAALLKVVDGLKVYDVRQFYQALYRPELVSELMKGDVSGKYEAAAGNLNLRKVLDSGPAPRLELRRSERVGDSVKVTVEITDAGGGIGKVEWRVNDVLLDGERGMSLVAEDESDLIETRSFPLSAGGNVIAVTAYNKAGLITAAPLVEKVDGQGIAKADKSRLFILAVGINDYAQRDLQLTNAVNDAEAFSSRFKTAAEGLGLFSEVSLRTMVNGEVTRERLDRAFTELAGEIGPDDKFVFFAAGHAKVYKDRYYFFPQDLHFGSGDAIISQGIDQATWQTWFSRIPARASVLIYDTCDAGQMTMAMRGNEDIRTAVDLLKNATGRSVLAATTSEDVAREGFEHHGVFTYALLKALSDGDQNGDGRIEVIELGQYVERMVPELTEKKWGMAQRPRFTINANFPIAATMAPDSNADAVIPRAATHVIIAPVTVASADRGAPADKDKLQPGTTVRVLKADGDRALIARDGRQLGFVPVKALAPLN